MSGTITNVATGGKSATASTELYAPGALDARGFSPHNASSAGIRAISARIHSGSRDITASLGS